jgi:Amidohydrolase
MKVTPWLMASLAALSLSCIAEDTESSKKLAQEVPIADVHRHVQRWVSPELLKQQMEKSNVRWSGAVGAPFGPFDTTPYAKLLQNKYIATTGQVELGDIFGQHGAAGLTDINLRTYQELLAGADKLFSSGQVKGFGELILNNKQTNPNVSFRRKVKIDSAPIEAMFAIADKHKGFVQIHSEDDPDSVEELKSLSTKYANTALILSHCLFTSNVDLIRNLLANSANIYCEMSARSRSHFPNPDSERAKPLIVYSEDSVKPEWVALIEEFPTRFMVGTDTYNPRVNFEKNIEEIRGGLLSKLKASTIELVAYKNAVRVMRLE